MWHKMVMPGGVTSAQLSSGLETLRWGLGNAPGRSGGGGGRADGCEVGNGCEQQAAGLLRPAQQPETHPRQQHTALPGCHSVSPNGSALGSRVGEGSGTISMPGQQLGHGKLWFIWDGFQVWGGGAELWGPDGWGSDPLVHQDVVGLLKPEGMGCWCGGEP